MGTVKIRFLAHLKEQVGREEVTLNMPGPSSLKQVLIALEETTPSTKSVTQNSALRVAVNQEMVVESVVIQNGDEIAFLPPFSGG